MAGNYVTTRFVSIPEHIAEPARIKAEKQRQARAIRDSKREDRTHGRKHPPASEREFIVWDGEGPKDTGYSLLGNSKGDEICYRHLRTKDCLNLFLESAQNYPNAIHVAFGFTYDVSCILWELSWRHLNGLYKFNRTHWGDYTIEHVPRKWFIVKRGNVRITIYDIHSFFQTSLVEGLKNWGIGAFKDLEDDTDIVTSVPPLDTVRSMTDEQLVRTFKKLRGDFLWKDISQIAIYMRLELKYTKLMMEALRNAFVSAGYLPSRWHGPGAVTRIAFKRHGVYRVLVHCPEPVSVAARYAFVAGRFELVKAGHIGHVHTADINSAYPYFTSQLPNLSKGEWRHTDHYESGKFAIYHIRYNAKPDGFRIYPLPFRDKHNMIVWPHRVTGWYWNPEAELVADDPDATFIEGWVFDEDDSSDKPFTWVRDYYNQRRKWKDEGNPAEITLKYIINAIYGQFAQRVGWNKRSKTPPKTHQLEFAGWITSSCRAMVYKTALRCGDSLVSIDTDGVTSMAPFKWLSNSKELGGWKLEEFEDSIFWQSGIYVLKQEGEWKKAKSRGIPKGSYTAEELLVCLAENKPLKLTKKVFISYGLALNGQRKNLNKWMDEPHVYKFGGAGKRYHDTGSKVRIHGCHDLCLGNGIHRLRLPTVFYSPSFDTNSHPHKLPWITAREEYEPKQFLINLMMYDRNDMDFDDEWSLTYADTG